MDKVKLSVFFYRFLIVFIISSFLAAVVVELSIDSYLQAAAVAFCFIFFTWWCLHAWNGKRFSFLVRPALSLAFILLTVYWDYNWHKENMESSKGSHRSRAKK
jgi:glycerol uptake facilitator-like aquaporin